VSNETENQERSSSSETNTRRRKWRPLWRLSRRTGTVVLLSTVLALILATTIGIEISHALGSSGSPTTTLATSSSTTTAPGGGSSSSGSSSSTTTTVVAESGTPNFDPTGGSTDGNGAFNAVACPSTSVCFAAGADDSGDAIVAQSTDFGASWSDESLPSGALELDAISCEDVSDCVAVGRGTVLTTNDGGNTWTLSDPPTPQTTLLGVRCSGSGGSGTCIAVGMSPNPGGPYDGEIALSTDGGDTWTASTLPPNAPGVGDVTCPTTTLCIAVGAEILESSDGGQTWQYSEVDGGTEALRSISCSSTTQCIALGANPEGEYDTSAAATAIITTDGGQTWQQDSSPVGSAGLDEIACTDASNCIAGGGKTIADGIASFAMSSDGGRTWTSTSPPTDLTSIAGIACPQTNQCLVVGHENAVSATSATTDGSSWQTTVVSQSVGVDSN
jgi:photosystem II stability/assembly factor-like uncharacterized protein